MRKPFYWKARKSWYLKDGNTQVKLGDTEEEAYEAWEAYKTQPSGNTTVVKLIDKYLDWLQKHRSERTYDWYLMHLESFAKHISKRLKVSKLKPHHVTEWIGKVHSDNKDNTVRGAMRSVQRVCNWAVKQGYIAQSPLANLEKPRQTSREVVISPDLWDKMFKVTTDDAERDLLTAMREMGCRPQEIRVIEALHFDEPERRVIFPVKDSKGKRRNRVIYLTDAAFDIIKRLSTENPSGPIFRNSKELPWSPNAIRCRFRKFKKLGVPDLCATVIRHTYTTDALKRGVNPIVLADLLGHTDITTLSRNYAHLFKDAELLRSQAKRATGEGA